MQVTGFHVMLIKSNAYICWLNLYAGIRNLLDEDYYANVRINANANRPVAERGYFEPGPGTTFYAGLEWVF